MEFHEESIWVLPTPVQKKSSWEEDAHVGSVTTISLFKHGLAHAMPTHFNLHSHWSNLPSHSQFSHYWNNIWNGSKGDSRVWLSTTGAPLVTDVWVIKHTDPSLQLGSRSQQRSRKGLFIQKSAGRPGGWLDWSRKLLSGQDLESQLSSGKRLGFTLDRFPVHHRATCRQTAMHTHNRSNGQLKPPIKLTCMSLDWILGPGTWRKPSQAQREHVNSTQKSCQGFN